MLLLGGFKLTKYISNSREVLEAIPVELRAKGVKHIDLNSSELPSWRALGVQWNTETDEFGFKIRLRDRPCTRRGLISIISSVYDPFGFLCPVVLKAKIIFQNECRLKKGWDEPLQDINWEKWDAWIHGLPDVEQFKVDRCLVPSTFGEVKVCELHHFADASCDGYGSVSYLRVVNTHGQIHCAFLMGKSRLAPLKQLTIPRLELSAAVISVKLDEMLTTRAIHIEKLDTMDTDSFINALKRFVCRRGQPARIRSDNVSNFKCGEKELREAIQSWNQKQIHDYLLQHEIEWEFNPPTASHMGGVWERQIRTVRKVLTALLEHETLDDECLNTVFCEVESVVNSRPITPVSGDPSDAEPLTPNHLLLLRSGPEMLSDNFCKANIYRRRWKRVQFLADVFWKRWLMEYLPTLQLRQKWLKEKQNFREGDVVLIMDYSTPRKVWPLGKITRTFPGQDGLVRAVEVKSKGLLLRRPVHKLCMLESVND